MAPFFCGPIQILSHCHDGTQALERHHPNLLILGSPRIPFCALQ